MIITPSYVFTHLPKTGGFWVRQVLEANGVTRYIGPMHTTPGEILPVMGGRYSFTFIRHPVTWWRSFWAHTNQRGWPVSQHVFEPIAQVCMWHSYQAFMERVLNDIPGQYAKIVDVYTHSVARVGRFENLAADLVRFTAEAGAPLVANRAPANVGTYTDLTASTPEIDAEIMRTEAEVIRAFYGG